MSEYHITQFVDGRRLAKATTTVNVVPSGTPVTVRVGALRVVEAVIAINVTSSVPASSPAIIGVSVGGKGEDANVVGFTVYGAGATLGLEVLALGV